MRTLVVDGVLGGWLIAYLAHASRPIDRMAWRRPPFFGCLLPLRSSSYV